MAEYQYDPCNYCAFGDACPSAHFWPFGYHKCADMKDMREQPKEVLTMADQMQLYDTSEKQSSNNTGKVKRKWENGFQR